MATSPQDLFRLKVVTVSNGCTDPPDLNYEWYNRHAMAPNGVTEFRPDTDVSEVDISGCPVCVVPDAFEDDRVDVDCGYETREFPLMAVVTFSDDMVFSGSGDGITVTLVKNCDGIARSRDGVISWSDLSAAMNEIFRANRAFLVAADGPLVNSYDIVFETLANDYQDIGRVQIPVEIDSAFPDECDVSGTSIVVDARVAVRLRAFRDCDDLRINAWVLVDAPEWGNTRVDTSTVSTPGEQWALGLFSSCGSAWEAAIDFADIPATLESWPITLTTTETIGVSDHQVTGPPNTCFGSTYIQPVSGGGTITITPAFMWGA